MLAQGPPAEGADPAQIERIPQGADRGARDDGRAEDRCRRPGVQSDRARAEVRQTLVGRTGRPSRLIFVRGSGAITTSSSIGVTRRSSGARRSIQSGFPSCRLLNSWSSTSRPPTGKREKRTRVRKVRRALEELLACRANPDKPGCAARTRPPTSHSGLPLRPPTSDLRPPTSRPPTSLIDAIICCHPPVWIKSSFATSRSSPISTTANRRWPTASSNTGALQKREWRRSSSTHGPRA